MPIRVAVVEDHPLMLKAVVQELEGEDDIQVVGTATHGSELHRLVRETSPDVVVLDLGMSQGSFEPTTAVEALRETHPSVEILVLTNYDDEAWVQALVSAGAQGYVLKSDDLSLCLPEGVRCLHSGRRFYSPAVTDRFFACKSATSLTDQELVVLNLAVQGFSNARIGQELGLSEKTVRNHFSSIYARLGIEAGEGVNPRVAAIYRARQMGLLREDA